MLIRINIERAQRLGQLTASATLTTKAIQLVPTAQHSLDQLIRVITAPTVIQHRPADGVSHSSTPNDSAMARRMPPLMQ